MRPFLAITVAAALFSSGVAQAARPRRPSAAQIKAMQENMAYMQLEMVRFQTEMAAKQQELAQSFDQDGDGRLTGGEKARYERQLHAIQAGAAANPFATIAPVGKGPRPKSPLQELKDRTATFNSEVVAKQQEIFRSFDENGNGHLEGPEQAKFNKHMHDIQTGAAPNPFADAAAHAAHGSPASQASK
ncbi:MAG: hypothetical protein EBZ74_09450 [Planctomycetia bacterium]|nr:hypothetical protein [Planctomycetia bacterium]